QLPPDQMQAFADFALQITYPPNPIRRLDNSLTPDQQAGKDFFFGGISDTFLPCSGCHVLNPSGNAEFGVARPGFFGTDGRFPLTPDGFLKRRQVEQFLLAFDSNLAPIVGQQVTITAGNRAVAESRVQLFLARAERGECDVVAKRNGRGFAYQGAGFFRPDSIRDSPMTFSQPLALVGVHEGE